MPRICVRNLIKVFTLLFVFGLFLGATTRSIVPPYQVLKTKNGVEIYFFPSPNIPIFQVELVFNGGGALDPKGKSGLGLFSISMMKKGIPEMDENALFQRIDDLASSIEVSVNDERTNISAYGLNEHAAETINLLFRELSSPVFPEGPFQRLKTNHLDDIAQMPDSPAALAGQVEDLLVFNGTEKARPAMGTLRDVKSLSLKEIKAYYPELIRTDRLKVLVIGGKSKSEILDQVIKKIEELPCARCGKKIPNPVVWDIKDWRHPQGQAVVVKRPGVSEAHIRMGFKGPRRKIPEFYDLRIAETILSGYFGSRMNLIIREKLNLTYGISAGFSFGETSGSFDVATSTRNEKIGELIVQTNKLLREFVDKGVTSEELKMAKDYISGSFPLGLQNLYVIATAFFDGKIIGLDSDFMDVYVDKVKGATVESVNAAIQKYFQLKDMITVIAGDASKIEVPLRKAGIRYVVRDPQPYL